MRPREQSLLRALEGVFFGSSNYDGYVLRRL